jgi:hypothetical protein
MKKVHEVTRLVEWSGVTLRCGNRKTGLNCEERPLAQYSGVKGSGATWQSDYTMERKGFAQATSDCHVA